MGGRGAGGAGSVAGLADTGLGACGPACSLAGWAPATIKRSPSLPPLYHNQHCFRPPNTFALPGCLLQLGQLLGLASSVLLLQALEAAGHPEAAIPAWAAAHSVHVALRYVALRSLRFPWPNQVGSC